VEAVEAETAAATAEAEAEKAAAARLAVRSQESPGGIPVAEE